MFTADFIYKTALQKPKKKSSRLVELKVKST